MSMTQEEHNKREESLKKFYKDYCNPDFYSIFDLHQIKDINKEYPRVYRISSNRSDGKTTNILTMFLYLWDVAKEEFVIFVRDKYEMENINKRFSTSLQILDYDNRYAIRPNIVGNVYYEYYLTCYDEDGKHIIDEDRIGFCVPLKKPDDLRNYSSEFKKVQRAAFDEFQLESGKYMKNEVGLLMSCLISICRGFGQYSREIDLYLMGNDIADNLNPWDIALHLNKYLKNQKGRFVKGNGFVAEFHYNPKAAEAIEHNTTLQAFSDSAQGKRYLDFSTGKSALVNVGSFIRKLKGKSIYVATFLMDGHEYGLRKCVNDGCYYLSNKADTSYKMRIVWDYQSQIEETRHIDSLRAFKSRIIEAYRSGQLYFSDEETKYLFLEAMSINIYK